MSSNSKLQRFVDKIERLDETIREHNTEKSEEEEAIVATYLAELG